VESFAVNTCIVNGPAPTNEEQWPNNKPHRVHVVQVDDNSFVHAGRRAEDAGADVGQVG